jgi:ribosomal protein L16 Arg81 hydroxylase
MLTLNGEILLPEFQAWFSAEKIAQLTNYKFTAELIQRSRPFLENNDEYITLNFFLNGVQHSGIPRDEIFSKLGVLSEVEFSSALPSSFRITNVQRLDPVLQAYCLELQERFVRAVSCNLYFTPGSARNCFAYHADHQETFIIHLYGSKRWSFPLDEAQVPIRCLRESFIDNKKLTDAVMTMDVTPGQQLYVPYALVHKAEIIGDGPAIHLTFASREPNRKEVIKEFVDEVIARAGLSETSMEKVTSEDVRALIGQLKRTSFNINAEELSQKVRDKIFREEILTMKFGRKYKGQKLSNND